MLIRSCYFNRPDIVELLIKHKVNFEARTIQETSALITCVTRNKPVLADMLLRAGAKLNLHSENIQLREEIAKMSENMASVIQRHK